MSIQLLSHFVVNACSHQRVCLVTEQLEYVFDSVNTSIKCFYLSYLSMLPKTSILERKKRLDRETMAHIGTFRSHLFQALQMGTN